MAPWSKEYQYSRLAGDQPSNRDVEQDTKPPRNHRALGSYSRQTALLYAVILISIALNGYQWMINQDSIRSRGSGWSQYTNLSWDTPVVYEDITAFSGANKTLADESWDYLDASPVAVALSKEYQKEHNLPPSDPFPWDQSRGLYFVKAFHHIHCLRVFRRAFMDLDQGRKPMIRTEHVEHCLDSLRQDVMCKADDTPMPVSRDKESTGGGQVMQCRNWDKLVAWTQAPDQHACHRLPVSYRPQIHSLELYQYCPKDSPYYAVQKAYFEKFGHKNLFGDEVDEEAEE